jgi:uncharacterized tellurite resistance protein B-like protein
MAEEPKLTESMRDQLAAKLMGVFDSAAETQRSYYATHPDERPKPGDVDAIIAKYSNINAVIAGGLTLIPGPWGLIAVVPEIVVVIRNQVKMVYDIGIALGKDEVMTRELLLGITMSASGTGTMGLLTMHGGKVLVKRNALRVFQRLVTAFAGKVTQRVVKSAIAKWLPIIGALAMAVWTRATTAAIGRKAKEILSLPITITDEPLELTDDDLLADSGTIAMAQKLVVLANLMKVDGEIKPVEIEFLETILAHATDVDDDVVRGIRTTMEQPSQDPVDLGPFQDSSEAFALVMDMVALANRDGQFHPAEKVYIRHVANQINFPKEDIETLIA